jgi:hypothetical protein
MFRRSALGVVGQFNKALYGPIKPITCVSLSVAPLPVLPKIVTMQSPALTFTGTEKMVSTLF